MITNKEFYIMKHVEETYHDFTYDLAVMWEVEGMDELNLPKDKCIGYSVEDIFKPIEDYLNGKLSCRDMLTRLSAIENACEIYTIYTLHSVMPLIHPYRTFAKARYEGQLEYKEHARV